MRTFRLLGTIELSADGASLDDVLRGPKRVALLAYLAIATPRGPHRRDSLVALLWPELDQERARAALRHTLYHLRRALGPDAIATVGDEAVALAESALSCDAVEVDRLLETGRDEEALALYRGDLLRGFFLSGAVEFERWLDGERARLRARAARAAWRLSERAEGAGVPEEAVRWARRAAEIEGDDETAFRRLIEVLDRTGNRAVALREYDAFAKRLDAELGVEPADETRAVVAAIRARESGGGGRRVEGGARDSGLGTRDSGLESRPVDVGHRPPGDLAPPALHPPPRTRRPLIVAAAALVVLALAAWALWDARRPGVDAHAVAVLPFEVRGNDQLRYLQQGMVDLLSMKLDGVVGYRSVDPRALVRASGGEPVRDDAAARNVARRVGARLYVVGSVVQAGDRVRLSATMYDADGTRRGSAETRAAPPAQLFELVDDLARQLLVDQFGARNASLARLAASTTGSLEAMRAYLGGEQALREGRAEVALESFRQAVQSDTNFALAHYRLAGAAAWTTDTMLARMSTDRATRLADRLPLHARRLLAAENAMHHRRFAAAESLYMAAADSRPDYAEPWFGLGDLYYHFNALRGRSRGEARGPLARALAVDPGHGEARAHLLELATYDGSAAEVDSLLARLSPDNDFAAKWPLVRALLTHDSATQARVLERSRALDDRGVVRTVIHAVAAFPNELPGALRVTGLLVEPSRAPGWQAYGHQLRAGLEAARGRWDAARAELTALGALEPAAGTEFGAYYTATLPLPIPRREVEATREALERWDAAATPPTSTRVFASHDGIHPELRLYLIGLLAARLGDTAAVSRHAAELEARALPDTTTRVALVSRAFARGLRARVLRARGRPAEALVALGEPWLDLPSRHSSASAILGFLGDRWLRAELLAESRRTGDALRVYSSVADYTLDGLPWLAPSLTARAAILERSDRGAAARHLARALTLWKDADPMLASTRDDLQRRRARLESR